MSQVRILSPRPLCFETANYGSLFYGPKKVEFFLLIMFFGLVHPWPAGFGFSQTGPIYHPRTRVVQMESLQIS